MIKATKTIIGDMPIQPVVTLKEVNPSDYWLPDYFDDDIDYGDSILRRTDIRFSYNMKNNSYYTEISNLEADKKYILIKNTRKYLTTSWENNIPPGEHVISHCIFVEEQKK